MTDPRDDLLAEAAQMMGWGGPVFCRRPGGPGGQTVDNQSAPCGTCRPCRVNAWLARYEAERAGRGMILQLPDPELRLRVAALLQLHWRTLTEVQLDAIKELVERDIAARTAPATPGKGGAK